MSKTSRRGRWVALAAASALAAAITGGVAGAAPSPQGTDPGSDAARPQTGNDQSRAIVRLSREPLATSPRTAPGRGRKIDFGSAAVRSERAALAEQRTAFKSWLRQNAPDAQVTGEYDVALNAVAVKLNGTSLATLRSAPGVVSAGYEGLYTPTATDSDPDLSLINAQSAWSRTGSGAAGAGKGMVVGIVDTGIDAWHPCFRDAGTHQGDLTNSKVITAKVFYNKAGQQQLTPAAVQEHGTHVAGTVACNYQTAAAVDGVTIPYAPSGVAPAARLASYNVFPGAVDNARSEDILDALQAAQEDGVDVINMSLGGGARGSQDLLTLAVDNIDRAGIVVAVAAGNSGPGASTVESPGSAERALTAGASSVGHFVGLPVTVGGASILTAIGDFATPTQDLTGTLVAASPGSATNPLGLGCAVGAYAAPADPAKTWVAVVSRGSCTFGTKVQVAQDAGADAVIVVNNVAGDPTAMGGDGVNDPKIPAVMASLAERAILADQAKAGASATIGSQAAYQLTGNDNIMAGFSSQGPTDVDYRVKPDLVAPGVNVLSSIPMSYCTDQTVGCWAFFQGTSMATPHLAGAAAVVRSAHRSWDPWQVRSALTNTAVEGVLKDSTTGTRLEGNPQVVGAGLADVAGAVDAKLALSSVSTSFGAVPSGSGQTLSKQLAVTNLTAGALKLPITVSGDKAFGVSTSSLQLGAGETKTLSVSFLSGKGETAGGHSAMLRLGDGTHSVLYAFVK